MMQSVAEHQENPKGETAVTPVGELRKWRRVQNLAAERRQKRKERTRGNRGSRRKLAAARRTVSRHATVAWRKRNIFRKIGTLEMCGQHKGCSHEGPSLEQGRWKNKTRNKFATGT
jgi:hypothetical protein